jgi:hypothetical protein
VLQIDTDHKMLGLAKKIDIVAPMSFGNCGYAFPTIVVDLQMNRHKICVIEVMCARELGDRSRRDALAKPVRLLDEDKAFV